MMDETSIKKNIRMIRRRRGISQEQMAAALHLTRGSYCNIERGPVRIIHEKVYAMAPLLDVSLEELFLGYQPDQDAIARLYEAEVEYEEKYRRMQDELSGKLDDRTSEMAALREVIESQKATIRTQDEIIAMLRRRISEESSSEN